jgi:hypothetical protein
MPHYRDQFVAKGSRLKQVRDRSECEPACERCRTGFSSAAGYHAQSPEHDQVSCGGQPIGDKAAMSSEQVEAKLSVVLRARVIEWQEFPESHAPTVA